MKNIPIARPEDDYSPLWPLWRSQNPGVVLGVGADVADDGDDGDGADDDASDNDAGDKGGKSDGLMGKPGAGGKKADNRHPAEIMQDKGKNDDPDADKGDKGKPKDDGKGKRPDHIPEKFWDAEKGVVKTDEMAKAYATLETAHGKLKGAQKGTVPEKPEDYFGKEGLVKPEGADRVRDFAPDDPAVKAVAIAAQKAGVTKEQLAVLAPEFLTALNEFLPEPLDMEAEMESLGKGGPALVSGLKIWLDGLHDSGELSADELKFAYGFGSTAIGVRTLNKLRSQTGAKPIPMDLPSGDALPSADELYAMKRDPRYKNDPAFRDKVERQFEEVFGNEAAGSSQPGLGVPPANRPTGHLKTKR